MIQKPVNSYSGIYYRKILSYMKKAFKNIDLTFEEGVVLQYAANNPGTSQDKIARALIFDTAAVARALKELEAKNMVIREIDQNNQRKKTVNLTEKGREYNDHINEAMRLWDDKVFGSLSPEETERTIGVMQYLQESAENIDMKELISVFKNNLQG